MNWVTSTSRKRFDGRHSIYLNASISQLAKKGKKIMKNRTNLVFCCSAYRGNVEENLKKARQYVRLIVLCGYSPVAPHVLMHGVLDDSNPEERTKGIALGIDQLKLCDSVWVFGTKITEGMRFELEKAKELRIPVRLLDDDANFIESSTLDIDDRVDAEYRNIVKTLNLI
jgi:hypothetical protein